MRIGPGFKEPRARALSLVFVLAVLAVMCTWSGSRAAVAGCVSVKAPADLQAKLNAAGKGRTVCLSGTFSSRVSIKPLAGQTIVGGHLKYTGSYRICSGCTNFTDGWVLTAAGVTLRNVEVSGFEGKGVRCGPGSVIENSYVHGNKQQGIGCTAQQQDWAIRITGNRISDNGSPILEGFGAGGVKLMELSKPGHALGAGAVVSGNVVTGNVGNGVWLDRASSASVIGPNNVLANNTRRGFRCEKCGGPVVVKGNRIYGNNYQGIDFTSSGVGEISGNTIYGNAKGAIFVHEDHRAKKTYVSGVVGDSTTGWHIKSILIADIRLATGSVGDCNARGVTCRR